MAEVRDENGNIVVSGIQEDGMNSESVRDIRGRIVASTTRPSEQAVHGKNDLAGEWTGVADDGHARLHLLCSR